MPDVPAASLKPFFEVTTSDWENPHYLLIAMTEVQLQTCLLSHVHAGTNRNLTVVKSDRDDKFMAMSWKVNHIHLEMNMYILFVACHLCKLYLTFARKMFF